ncbi:uncharacterized protein LOC131675528 [Phymastichus coffea]|uniref:uncharacterized protein LOC131675528 n=1 Tax=Phymastichus coffea TaxID=108790 RepID=UPI00273B6CDF|nr:uncharacterized protein LOC131675528 [Phymastichus coffea]
MGYLPAPCVTPARPFTHCGVDYAGPIQVRASKGRGKASYKGCIVLFVCFATKVVHLELASDLIINTFITAFPRFVACQGICAHLYSDNASNFGDADTELKAMFKAASTTYHQAAAVLAKDKVTWTFIPPNIPHCGGLWEAGVRSVKHK